MTPVDIDKLKELLAKATQPPWKAVPSIEWDFFSIYPDTGKREFPIATEPLLEGKQYLDSAWLRANFSVIVAAVNALPSLILMAERVERLEAALKPFAQVAEGEAYKLFAQEARLTFTLCRPDGKRFCFINAECFDAARNALCPTTTEDQHG